MPPKKAKKIALSEFLGDTALGSWADEMEELPSAPAPKGDDDAGRGSDSRFGRDMARSERPGFSREEIPLPSAPPYTAFVGNLAFDILEDDVANHFSELKINTVKIIKDKDDRPKGFGYVEFSSLDDLKEAIARSGSSLSGRAVRVSVAEPPKERSGFGGGDDDSKFDNPWRRDGPLPDLPKGGDRGERRRFEPSATTDRAPSMTDGVNDWRSSRPPRASAPPPESDPSNFKRKGSGQFPTDSGADKEESWTIGGRFKPSAAGGEESGSRFGGARKSEFGQPRDAPVGESDWRSSRPARAPPTGSPVDSTPPTPQAGGRRKLELLPRSGPVSTSPTPLSSPKLQPATSRSNPFGAAKPVDVTQREKEVEQKLERDREAHKEQKGHTLSRTTSRTASERTAGPRISTPPPSQGRTPASPKPIPASLASTVRPTLSFASAAAKKEAAAKAEEATKDEAEAEA